jgi:P27 family predicted phage terminase small subunit
MRGRKPVAAPLGDVVELPSSATRVPECPTYLQGRARECWEQVTRELVGRNIYDTDIRDVVAAYCIQQARFLEAEEKILKHGTISHRSRIQKMDRVRVWVTVSNQAYDRMMRHAAELGLTPISRQRVAKVRGANNMSPASKFLKKATTA